MTRPSAALFAAVLAVAGATGVMAQQTPEMTARDFVALGDDRKRDVTGRLVAANETIVDDCAPGKSVDDLAEMYAAWIAANPVAADQPAYLGFTRMLTQGCAQR